MTNDAHIQEIKHRLPLEQYVQKYVQLKRSGNRWLGLCPFHQEKSPSFTINETSGFFHCFGCHASGDIFTFYQQFNGVHFKEALLALAEEANVQLDATMRTGSSANSKQTLYKLYALAKGHFISNLYSPAGSEYRAYLASRNITEKSIQLFGIGCATESWDSLLNEARRNSFSMEEIKQSGLFSVRESRVFDTFRNRLMFPITTITDAVIAFGGRILPAQDNSSAKYINSPETSIYTKGKHLYGLAQARTSIMKQKYITLTEGYLDTIMLHQYGYTTACAILGTALTVEQVERIATLAPTVELVLDADEAGKKATLRSTELLLHKGIAVRVLCLPDGEDIDSYLQNHGVESFENIRKKALQGIDFCIQQIKARSPKEIAEWIHSFLSAITDNVIAAQYISKLSHGFSVDEQSIRGTFPTMQTQVKNTTVSLANPSNDTSIEREMMILKHLMHYPHNREQLRNAGLDLVVHSKEMKEIIQYLYAGKNQTEILHLLSEQAKRIFVRANVETEPIPCNEHVELHDLLEYLDKEYRKRGLASTTMLMSSSNDIATLAVLDTILRGKHNA